MEIDQNAEKLDSIITILSIGLPTLFIAYCLVYLSACPSPRLAAAVGAELFALIISIVVIRAKLFSFPSKLIELIPLSLRKKIERVQNGIRWCKFTVLSMFLLYILIDFSALCLSVVHYFTPAIVLYTAFLALLENPPVPNAALKSLAALNRRR